MPGTDSQSNNPYASPTGEPWPATSASSRGPLVIACVSIAIFVAALPLDGYYIARDGFDKADPAWGLLLIGWLGLGETFAWFANPMLLVAWLMVGRKQGPAATLAASLAFALSLSFLLNDRIICDEGGNRSPVIGYGYGYGLWVASIVVALIAAVVTLAERPPQISDDREWWAEHRRNIAKAKALKNLDLK